MSIRRNKYVSTQTKWNSPLPGSSSESSQRMRSRRTLATCLTLTGLTTLAVVALTGLLCASIGLVLWWPANPVAQQPHRPNPARFPSATPTPTPLPTGIPAQSVIATPTPPPSDSYQTVVAMAVQAQQAAQTPAAPANASAANSGAQAGQPTLTALVGLNVRSGPGLDYPVIGKLAAGQSVQVSAKDATGAWWQIEYPSGSGGQGWVSADPQYSTVSNGQAMAIAQAPPTPTSTPTAAVTPTPAAPTATSPANNSAVPSAGGWSFTAMRADAIPERKLLMLYGEMVNDSSTAQQISLVTGTFYDGQGQVIAADKSTYGLWPTNVVPPGGHVPFALTAYDVQDAADFKLSVRAEVVNVTPRQDFEFVTVNEKREDGLYCLNGALKNPGSQLTDYLVIVAILYDDQGKVLRFFNARETAVTEVVGDRTLDFETCLESPPANVARHELLAWGS